jgi:two-component system OmpR family sensor kinase
VFASVIQGEETNSFGQAQVVNFVLVVAFPLTAVNHTMGHILELELIIGAAVLLALALMSWFFVQLELRPLERMTATASEIAAGDLTRRIEDTDERTEVGQLGAALNVMLTQIERAFREREASEARLRRFVGDASHELRTPLTSIRGYAELFKNGPVGRPEDLAAALGRIESESTRMGGLVDDLLLLARLDQGRPLGHDRVDLSQLAADAVLDAGVVNPSRSVRLVSAGPGVVVGDDQRLRQVLGNLLTNAMAYSPPESPIEVAVHVDHAPIGVPGLRDIPSPSSAGRFGRLNRGGRSSGQITPAVAPPRPLGATDLTLGPDGEVSENSENGVSTVTGPVAAAPAGRDDDVGRDGAPPVPADQPAGEWARAAVTVEVIDHGPGIPPGMLPFVFERFWRADESRQRSSGGSGLGLSIVAAVVAAHGGRVTIRQTPGGGATFVVELPAAPAAFPGPGGLHTLTGPDVGNGVSSSVPGVIEVAGVPGATGLEE